MTFRLRLALVSALVVAIVVAAASAIVYVVMRSELRQNVDTELRQNAQTIVSDIQHRGNFAVRDLAEQGRSFARGGPESTRDYIQSSTPRDTSTCCPTKSSPFPSPRQRTRS